MGTAKPSETTIKKSIYPFLDGSTKFLDPEVCTVEGRGTARGPRRKKHERFWMQITEYAGCGYSCLADAPNSVGRADVKQTTGN